MTAEAHDEQKRAAALAAVAAEVRSGMLVGLGSGSTAYFVTLEIGRRVREEGWTIRGVPTSLHTAQLATQHGISVVQLTEPLDVALDGADEIDSELTLTKGGGGALTREKVVAQAAKRFVVVADESKLTPQLRWPVPVETVTFAEHLVRWQMREHFPGGEPVLRQHDGKPFLTDNGHLILDLAFPDRRPPAAELATALKGFTGVIEQGLFVGMRPVVYVGGAAGVRVLR